MTLSPAQKQVLLALVTGWTLKVHRHLDGQKEYRLHALSGERSQDVDRETVEGLRERAYIDSNKKFPAATYLLTERGKRVAETVASQQGEEMDGAGPLTSSRWK